jgi:predicted glutamine amidotransferase
MARLFGFIGNRPDLGVKALAADDQLFEERASGGQALGWGVGYYQGGEVLLRRRPLDDRALVSFGEVLRGVRTDALIAHVRRATVGAMRTENTHPFRFRQWLFAHAGTVAGFESLRERLVESLPEFLRRNVRGDTDSELLFHLFLSFLHDGGKLQQPQVSPADARAALRSSLALVDRLSAEEGATPTGSNVLLTDGEFLVGTHGSGNMAFRVIRGRHDLEELLGDDGLRRTRIPEMATCHFCLVAADFDPPSRPVAYHDVPTTSLVTVQRGQDPALEAL